MPKVFEVKSIEEAKKQIEKSGTVDNHIFKFDKNGDVYQVKL